MTEAGTRSPRLVVSVDRERCQGHARCWDIYPEVFTLDDDGYSTVGSNVPVPDGHEEQARRAVQSCPEHALSMQSVDR